MRVSPKLAESAEFISECPKCDGRFYHSMTVVATIPESPHCSVNLSVGADLQVHSQICVGVPNDSCIRQYSVPSQWSIMELTQARIRGNRSKQHIVRHGSLSGKKNRRAIYEQLYRTIVSDDDKTLGAVASNPAFPRDSEWNEQVRAYVIPQLLAGEQQAREQAKYQGDIKTQSTSLTAYCNEVSCSSYDVERRNSTCSIDHGCVCAWKNCAYKLHEFCT